MTPLAAVKLDNSKRRSAMTRQAERELDHVLLPREQFHRMLSRERKRSERSRKLVLLMLVSPANALKQGSAAEPSVFLADVAKTLGSLVRETDVVGWYDPDHALGVIFTEFGSFDAQKASETIEKKVRAELEQSFPASRMELLQISFFAFPEKWPDSGKTPESLFYPDLIEIQRRKKLSLTTKRCMDLLGSSMALMVLSPILTVLAALVKLTSRGPVFFRQKRIGQYGRTFTFVKFRSMYVSNDDKIHREYVKSFIAGTAKSSSAEDSKGTVYKITKDPRVTWIGGFMRRTSLDELPQFWNVLCGEMSLVGPRPPIPYELEAYDIWHRRRLLEVKPGITGLWQVRGRSRTTFDEMVRLDLEYSRMWSPALDLKILLQTPRAVFSGDGAY